MLDFSKLEELARESGAIVRSCSWAIVRSSSSGDVKHRTAISTETLTVGRRPTNLLCLSDPTVSGKHAELSIVDGELILTDLNSTNGTLVNGTRVTGSNVLQGGDVVHFGQVVFSVEKTVEVLSNGGAFGDKTCVASMPENAILYQGFDRLLNVPEIIPYFQPIVTLGNVETIGYEVLVRSSIEGLEYPDKIFNIAAMRKAESRLSEVCRSEGLLSAIQLDPGSQYFLNTHATELDTPRLIQSLHELRDDFPNMAIVLEIHEAAITSVHYLTQLIRELKHLNIDLAFDDFGAGQARLIELFEVPPKYLKFDLSFVSGLENASKLHRASVRALINMVHNLDVVALAEGVETQVQADICTDLGFDTAQGYFFGRPNPVHYWQAKMLTANTQAIPTSKVIPKSLSAEKFVL